MAVDQSGPVVPFHPVTWFGNGVVADGGTAEAPFITSLALFGGPDAPFSISSQMGAGVDTDPHARFSISQTDTTTTFHIEGVNGGVIPNVEFDVGGVIIPFPLGGPGNSSAILTAAQALVAPALVNISPTNQVRYADSVTGLPANGYILTDFAQGDPATVYFYGLLSGFSGLTGGPVFLSSNGDISTTPPTLSSGEYVQLVGVAIGIGTIFFSAGLMNGPV